MRDTITFFLLLILLAVTAHSVFGVGMKEVERLEVEVASQLERNEAELAHVEELKSEIVKLSSDERALEIYARERFGLTRENEILLLFDKPQEGS